jgi:hypothetical protein
MLYGEKLKEICEKLGINRADLPDNLYSTLLEAISENVSGGGSSGGGDATLIGLIERTGTEFVIPEGITKIGKSAFSNHSTVETVTIPNSVTSIEGTAFSNCKALVNVKLSENCTSLGASCFFGCSSLLNITIPASVKQILNYAFMDCKALTSVVIKGKLSFGTDVFDGCSNLKDIYVPWAEGAVSGAPWKATNATIHYNSEV